MNFGKTQRTTAMRKHHEDVEEDDMSNSGSFDESYLESDDCEYQVSKRLKTFAGSKSALPLKRKPTRVPNMKIQNRNALLARENRKRKKEMMETLEKTVDELQAENKSLHKIMKSKDSRINKLLREVQYLKSVISNRTEIVSILKSLPQLPAANGKTSYGMNNNNNCNNDKKDCASIGSSETLSCNDSDIENVATEWDEILENPFSSDADFSDIPKLDDVSSLPQFSPSSSDISTEHNYSHYEGEGTIQTLNDGSLPGVCLHIRTGRVSLEFCSVCHFNATNTWNSN